MKKIAWVLLLIMLTACSKATTTTGTSSSYPSAFAWNDSLYGASADEVPETEIGKEIGEIKKIVSPMPKENGDSNDKMGKLYELKGISDHEVIAFGENGKYHKAHKFGPLK